MSKSPLPNTNNQHQFKRNKFKSQRRNTQKRSSYVSQFQNGEQIFNKIIEQTPIYPVKVFAFEKEDIEIEQDYSNRFVRSSSRKTSSNLPTANNSCAQTPKISFDLDDTQNQNFQNTLFQKAVYDKLSNRKWSRDSASTYDSIDEQQHFVYQQPYRPKADDFKTKYKTELCKYFEINGTCKYGDNCAYAHGKDNLRTKVPKTSAYRTKKCKQFFENGFCPYGNRCQFAHAIKSNVVNNPNTKEQYSYKKIIELLSDENLKSDTLSLEKQRLPIFETIIKSNNNNNKQSTLVDDIRELSHDLINDNSSMSYKSNYVMNRFYDENDIENLLLKEEEYLCKMLNL